ncbi:uncharacterized protein FFB14_10429 [Fusarium fujikuroi]
MLLGF